MKVANLKKPGKAASVFAVLGTVLSVDGKLLVQTDNGPFEARRAASCLLECIPDDLVLLCVAGDEAWVLAVLTRDQPAAASVSVPGDLNLHLPNGKMRIEASQGLALTSQQEIAVVAPQLNVGAVHATLTADECSFFGRMFTAHMETLSLFARTVSSAFGLVYEKASRVFRKVEEIEQVQAGQLDLQARENLALHGRNSMMTADQLVKIDGAQIHLG